MPREPWEEVGQKLTSRSLAYLAGYFDGESCFTISGARGAQRVNGGTPRVSVSNTFLPALRKIQDLFGGSLRRKTKSRTPWHRDAWEWYCSGSDARGVCQILLPYLIEKAPQAELLLAYSTYPSGSQMRAQVRQELERLKRVTYTPEDL